MKAVLLVILVGALIVPCTMLTVMVVDANIQDLTVDCDEGERRVLATVPQYDGARPDVVGNSGACAVYYETRDDARPVLAHFERELVARGWTLERGGARAMNDTDDALAAMRGGYNFELTYLYGTGGGYATPLGPPRPNRLVVHVSGSE